VKVSVEARRGLLTLVNPLEGLLKLYTSVVVRLGRVDMEILKEGCGRLILHFESQSC
jgi:hypothetical protein